MTRPTAIHPTNTKNLKLKIKENVDIATIPKPQPQTVSLQTIDRKRPVMQMKRRISGTTNTLSFSSGHQETTREPRSANRNTTADVPCSPAPSELSSASLTSSSTSNTHGGTCSSTANEAKSITSGGLSLTSSDKTIVAQTEVLQGGCLPGDTIQVKVSVDHTKAIKSMQGIIMTFYRMARIDTHPAIPLGPSQGNTKAKYEDYYPKSRTGLGGLSLSSAGSSRTFLQDDFNQNIAPLIFDPQSLTAVLKTSIQVPEHIFPSIGNVPGSMISFKYYVEIIIDLRGKLGQDRLLPRFSMTNTPQHAYEDPKISMTEGKDGITFAATPGFNFLLTDNIRRQKGIVFTRTEVLVGTKDSVRLRSKQKEDINGKDRHSQDLEALSNLGTGSTYMNDPRQQSRGDRSSQNDRSSDLNNVEDSPRIPLPQPSEEPSDEKEQIRRAEQMLLPSEPPQENSSWQNVNPGASAPFALDEDDFIDRYRHGQPAPRYEARPSVHSVQNARSRQSSLTLSSPTPILYDFTNESSINKPDAGDDPENQRLRPQTGLLSGSHSEAVATDHITTSDQANGSGYERTLASPGEESSLSTRQRSAMPVLQSNGLSDDPRTEAMPVISGPDKQEMERARLEQLASAPEVDSADMEVGRPTADVTTIGPSAPIVDEELEDRSLYHGDTSTSSHEDLPRYRQ